MNTGLLQRALSVRTPALSALVCVVLVASACERAQEPPLVISEAPKPVVVAPTPPADPPPPVTKPDTKPIAKPDNKTVKPTPEKHAPTDPPPRKPVDPKPIPTEPKTVKTDPKPVVPDPKPVVPDPKPVTPDPKPVIPDPKPVTPVRGAATLVVRTTPAGATARLLDRNGKVVDERKTPATFAVQPGSYEWQIELAGFLNEGSAPEKLSLSANAPETLERTLIAAGDRPQVLARADAAFKTKNSAGCPQAITLYETIARPSDLSGVVGTEWVLAQLRIAQCSMQMKEWSRSLNALAAVKKARPREWTASYYEGQTLCRMGGQWEKGIGVLRDMAGDIGTLAVDVRQVVPLLSAYEIAQCDRAEFDASKQQERSLDLKDRFIDEYVLFVDGAKRLQARGFPSAYAVTLTDALANAQAMLAKYNTGTP